MMKRVLLLQAILLLFVSCNKFEELSGGGKRYAAPILVIGEVTDNSVEISFNYKEEHSAAESGVCYATHPSPSVDDGRYCYEGSPMVLEGLSPQTSYYIRSYLINEDEEVFYGYIFAFTTAEKSAKVLFEGFANYFQSVKAELRVLEEAAVSVGICWGRSSEPTVEPFHKAATYDASQGLWTVTVDGLEESSYYYLRAYVKNEEDKVFYSRDQMKFVTDGTYSPDMDICLPVHCEDTYADLTYCVVEKDIIRRGVCWATHPKPTLEDNKTVDGSVKGQMEIRLEGLDPATRYYIRPYVSLPHNYDEEKVYYGTDTSFTTYKADQFFEIPDKNFTTYLLGNFDRSGDGRVSIREAADVSKIELPRGYITSLEGIENFPNLVLLDCQNNRITSLDLRANTNLRILRCNKNEITHLELGRNSRLEVLECKSNRLPELDVSGLPSLQRLECDLNKLGTIDLSANSQLVYLSCSNNLFSELHLADNPLLEELFCYHCKLTCLDLSSNPKLTKVGCRWNELTYINLAGCTLLRRLDCSDNALASLNAADCTQLEALYCSSNPPMEALDVSGCNNLETLECSRNRIRKLDLSGKIYLYDVWCEENALESLDITGCSKLGYLRCEDNNLAFLSVRDLENLLTMYCKNNVLTDIDLKGAKRLRALNCTNNSLGALDVSDNASLEYLHCGRNDITSLDLRGNPAVRPETLICDSYVDVIWK